MRLSKLVIMIIFLLTISCTTVPSSKEKKSSSMFPEGIESITLLTATISPDIITTKGSDLKIYFTNNDSICTTNLIPVVVFVANTMTIKEYSTSGANINSNYIIINVSNPSSYDPRNHSYTKGRFSGSGTIYVYLEENSDISLGDKNRNDKVKRVSNILSVYATFE